MSPFEQEAACATTAHAWVEAGALLLDVRSPEEFAASHIPGACNLPLPELEARFAELWPKQQPIVLYCRSGARSARAATLLRGAGFARIHDLGAMLNWA